MLQFMTFLNVLNYLVHKFDVGTMFLQKYNSVRLTITVTPAEEFYQAHAQRGDYRGNLRPAVD